MDTDHINNILAHVNDKYKAGAPSTFPGDWLSYSQCYICHTAIINLPTDMGLFRLVMFNQHARGENFVKFTVRYSLALEPETRNIIV